MPSSSEHQRIAPLEPPYEQDVAAALAKWMPPGADTEPLRLFRTLNVHAELASRMRPLGAGILGAAATVPARLREIVIHRTCALTGARYEWGVHAAAFGRAVGLSDAQLYSTVHGSARDDCWDGEQASVFALAEQLHRTSTIDEELWRELAERFDQRQLLELIVTAGWYHVIGYVCNAAGVQLEDWASALPEVRPAGVAP